MNIENGFQQLVRAYSDSLPFLLFARPGSNEVEMAVDPEIINSDVQVTTGKVFVFAPFDRGHETYRARLDNTLTLDLPVAPLSDTLSDVAQDNKHGYIQLLNRAIEQLDADRFKKVVLSRRQQLVLKQFKLIELIHRLIALDKTAFRYVWYHPDTGIWAGATPEVLIERSSLGFRTMSLAGTRQATSHKGWNEKEYAEQAYVTDYIKDCLKGIVSSMEVEGPYNHKAGELIHLRTDIRGKLSAWSDLRTVLDRLHPTPAVCGTPLKQSLEFIRREETYKRRYYTGYLGLIDHDTNSAALFVNLRCMSIGEGVAYLYTGGGITAESDPEGEWLETCHKQHTMLKVLAPFL